LTTYKVASIIKTSKD